MWFDKGSILNPFYKARKWTKEIEVKMLKTLATSVVWTIVLVAVLNSL